MRCLAVFQQIRRLRLANFRSYGLWHSSHRHSCWCASGTTCWGGGILVKPEDPEDMAKAIEQICQLSDAEWRAMSETALEKVINYTWEDATNLFEAALYAAVERQRQLTNNT